MAKKEDYPIKDDHMRVDIIHNAKKSKFKAMPTNPSI